ncbi:MAG: aldolase/citrate lyase family protein, partial [Xanthobacteraceae bacterium]
MRSLLFVPADSAKKLGKGMTSGADALIVDLEDSIALDGKARARQSAAAFLKETVSAASRPYLVVRVHSLDTGLIDADLDAVIPEKPDAIMLPKAEGGAAVVHADAKLAVREALSNLPDGHVKIIALATETAAALFLAGT